MHSVLWLVRKGIQATGILVLLAGVTLVLSLMAPIKVWRTGELPAESIQVQPAEPFTASPVRVWIDTDAACGVSQRTDPDDCFAILLLDQQNVVEIVGVSTVFGNGPLRETDRTSRDLIDLLETSNPHAIPVYRGASEPIKQEENVRPREAPEALRKALEHKPLVIVALGPLTNIALALKDRPHLQANVTRLVAVMGRRKGHVFHPVEGGTAHSFLGHGPIFRDFNMTEDEQAAAAVLAMGLPLTLIPYEAARDVLLDRSTLKRMETLGGPAAWVAQRAHPWLTYWREDINIVGFYPFDLIAAAYVAQPSLLRCAHVPVAIEDDTWLFGWLGNRGLFVQSKEEVEPPPIALGTALYCSEVSTHLQTWLVDQLANVHESPGLQALAGAS
ncbi:MAG: nucleoside hydrolase [Nitrospira sp.]